MNIIEEGLTEIGDLGDMRYALEVVVCTHPEVISGGIEDGSGNGWSDEAVEISGDAIAVLSAAGIDYEMNRNWQAWNGGKFSSQASTYNYERRSFGAIRWNAAELARDEDGCIDDDAFEPIPTDSIPFEILGKVKSILDAADAAWERKRDALIPS